MFLNTFTDVAELIYVTTKDYLLSNLPSHGFDFLEKRGKKEHLIHFFFHKRPTAPPL